MTRQVRRDRSELGGGQQGSVGAAYGKLTGGSPDVRFETKHRAAEFAVGDRVQFTVTDKRRHIYNGNAAVITGIDVRSGQITARLDTTAGTPDREVTWAAAGLLRNSPGAGTAMQGRSTRGRQTLDHAYLLHTHHWRAAASYVALTRQREGARVFVSTEVTKDAAQLARQACDYRNRLIQAGTPGSAPDAAAQATPDPG